MSTKIAIKQDYHYDIFEDQVLRSDIIYTGYNIKLNGNLYKLYEPSNEEAKQYISKLFGDRLGYLIQQHNLISIGY